MELREVETFLVLADELHFARTAQRLFLTASRVTQMIQSLEREVGGPLFERTSRKVSLTPLGERFRDAARTGVDQLHSAVRDAQASARGAEHLLRLGYQYSTGPGLTLALAATFEDPTPRQRGRAEHTDRSVRLLIRAARRRRRSDHLVPRWHNE